MKNLFIADFKTGDSIFGETFAVKQWRKTSSRNNKPYVDLELSDSSGTIKGKIWSDDLSNCDSVSEGAVVTINGTVEEFNGPQLRITNLKETEKFDLADLQQTSKFNIDDMWKDVAKKIEELKNPHLKDLMHNIFTEEFTEKFKKAPAAFKLHHDYVGGLLEHTWEMLMMAEPLKAHYPKINMDLVNVGMILHDIGKVEELKVGTGITHSEKGKLLGHIYIGAEIVKHNAPKDMPEDLLYEVLHIVLAHSGEKEHGSPKVPMTGEAMAVYVIDFASFRLRMTYDKLTSSEGNENFSQYVPHLGTELYISPYSDELSNEDIPF